jgi:hypothetical protein
MKNKSSLLLIGSILSIVLFIIINNFQCILWDKSFRLRDCLYKGFGAPELLEIYIFEFIFQIFILVIIFLYLSKKINAKLIIIISIFAYEVFYFTNFPYPIYRYNLLLISFFFNLIFLLPLLIVTIFDSFNLKYLKQKDNEI